MRRKTLPRRAERGWLVGRTLVDARRAGAPNRLRVVETACREKSTADSQRHSPINVLAWIIKCVCQKDPYPQTEASLIISGRQEPLGERTMWRPLLASLALALFVIPADAHDPDGAWNPWLMLQKNVRGTSCCNGSDARF